jgi:hypothetical protein
MHAYACDNNTYVCKIIHIYDNFLYYAIYILTLMYMNTRILNESYMKEGIWICLILNDIVP